ncbi:MAG: phosphatidylserine/phosphatidylglycerophosphate/cardiolipin synthase family protein [Solobacterium sp.]|nr:phosphatidylserine/phosphatidylglycerophosphate/cardiolipin synthase family protein [Solobacterium sp.]
MNRIEMQEKTDYTSAFRLLEMGSNAFPEIIRQIRSATKEILIRMFIWREDRIGTAIAKELLRAADRGVLIVIEKDRYGLVLEYAEESQRSFCHSPSLSERIQIGLLCLFYNRDLYGKHLQTKQSALYRKLKEHPNVIMKDSRKTNDHSKYYIFDRRIMILGGINIEDKEYFRDSRGRVYYDCMVMIHDPEIISQFLHKRMFPQTKNDLFLVNAKEPVRCFEIKEGFLELIDAAESRLTILMAYFAPDKEIISAICRALERGVHVRILIPRSANYNNDTNRITVSKLLRSRQAEAGGKLSVYMTDYMLHAKLMMNEKRIITGSCNINRKSFTRLGELCISVNNDDSPFARQVRAGTEELFRNSERIDNCNDISFNRFLAFLETVVMR